MNTAIEHLYIDTHPKCAKQYSASKDLFPNGVTHDARNLKPFPYFVSHADGAHKWDIDGPDIIDYKGGHGALLLGHAHPEIAAAVIEQMGKGTHYAASTELEIRWARWVRELIPCAEKVRFLSSGTEATMMALRMARSFTGKTKVIKFTDHFHGWHDYARAHLAGAGGIPDETSSTMITLPPNDISVVAKVLEENQDIAAIILEPTGAHMGLVPVRPDWIADLREVTRKNGVVLIFDEVVTGFRTSRGGAQSYYEITPDISTLAKILGGGLPGGAVAGRADIIDMIQLRDDAEFNQSRRVSHNGTFNANPLSAAAGAKALELVASTPANDIADNRSVRLKNGLNDLLSRMEVTGCASGIASAIFLRLGVDHECDREICIMSNEDQHVVEDAVRNHQFGLAMYNHGVDGGPRFIVSAAHSERDIDDTVNAAERALKDLRAEGLI